MLNQYDEKYSPIIAFLIALFLHFLFFLLLAIIPYHITSSKRTIISFSVIRKNVKLKNLQEVQQPPKKSIAHKKINLRKKHSVVAAKVTHHRKNIIDLRKIKKIKKVPPSSYTPSKKNKILNKKPVPVFGLSPKSVKGEGGKNGFRVGNTLMMSPGKKIVPPNKVKPYVGPPLTPIALVTRLPRFKRMQKPKYPDKLRKMGIEGEVVLDVVITSDGKPVDIKVVKGDYPEFISAAVDAIKHSSFYPAKMGGKPVSVRIRIPIKFRLVE